jgi:hypothetical protein
MMCDLRSKGNGLRQGSRKFICIATLVASQLLFACVWAVAQSPKINSHTASIAQDVDVPDTSGANWCYDTGPAFVFNKDRTVFRYDASGKLLWQTSAPWEMGIIGGVFRAMHFMCPVRGNSARATETFMSGLTMRLRPGHRSRLPQAARSYTPGRAKVSTMQ